MMATPSTRHSDSQAAARPKAATETRVKRLFDLLAAGSALAAGAPALIAIGAAIRAESPGAALFIQERVGRQGRRFRIYKFRTMTSDAEVQFSSDGSTKVNANDTRVTQMGRLLRGGIDELPQLLNVLRGEMSLVGPRPDLPVHEKMLTPSERKKLAMLPGMTSLAAVLGRNGLPWKTRVAIDCVYVDNWSLGLDAKIVISTLCLPLRWQPFDFSDLIAGIDMSPRLD